MRDIQAIAKHMIATEAEKDESLDIATAGWWSELILRIVNELPPATAPRISELIVDYIVGGE